MSAETLIAACRQSGVQIDFDHGRIRLTGQTFAVRAAATRLRPHKAELLKYLATGGDLDVSGPYTPYCVPVPVELVRELHRLIEEFCRHWKCDDETTRRIIEAAKKQPVSTVRSDLILFRDPTPKPPSI